MLDRLDQNELLALIEGELDANQAAALRHRLAGEPQGAAVVALVDRMCADRLALRSLPEPELPQEVLAQLEALLARPMLMEPLEPVQAARPGEFRRQHRRQTRRIRWSRLAIAATVLMALAAGIWAVVNGLVLPTLKTGDGGTVAKNDSAVGPAGVVESKEKPALVGTVHHYLPSSIPVEATHLAVGNGESATNAATGPIAAEFAIVLRAGDSAAAEKALVAAATQGSEQVALVRNFNFAEAQQLAEEWRLAQGGKADRVVNPAVASAGRSNRNGSASSPEMNALAERVRQRLSSNGNHASPSGSAVTTSGVLAGAADQGPSLAQQLDFSSRGATHTVAIRASKLKGLLEGLALSKGSTTTLCMMRGADAAVESQPNSQPLLTWLTDSERVRKAYDRLASSSADTIVLVPVIVQTAK